MGIEELSHSDKMPMPITAKALPHRRLGMRLLVKRGSDGHPGSRPGAKTVADVAGAPGRNQVPRGIAYMLGSTVMFAGGNAVVKWQLATYPLGEVAFAFGRTLFAFLTLSRPAPATHPWTMRAYCRVEMCGRSRNLLGKRYRPLRAPRLESQS